MEKEKTITPQKREIPKPNIRELTLSNGISFPTDQELIMLLLGRGCKNHPIEELAEKVIQVIDDSKSENLIRELSNLEGLGAARALSIAAALEFGRRRNSYLRTVIDRPRDIIPYIQHYALSPTEHFVTATVNGAHELMNIRLVSVGTVNRTIIHPREIFADPVAEHASGIIVCHNHPNGPCIPSQADKNSTEVLQEAAEILGITFLDHIIINKESYFSFLEHHLI